MLIFPWALIGFIFIEELEVDLSVLLTTSCFEPSLSLRVGASFLALSDKTPSVVVDISGLCIFNDFFSSETVFLTAGASTNDAFVTLGEKVFLIAVFSLKEVFVTLGEIEERFRDTLMLGFFGGDGLFISFFNTP